MIQLSTYTKPDLQTPHPKFYNAGLLAISTTAGLLVIIVWVCYCKL